ncbi:hypothetical protein [Ruficoccus sp. ZRK36]|uniref:hypothetical protein n=1 Tax=Ruficoccus sp. ZRK36 TaxID=2866311 RepID=UPI001C73A083|nr:hypothetical protein [Ruficoccus sp. ZRK36]QYY37136.1 hypothetical protein K0V07_06550 [Ruficoccus sp. ZRK36]
MAKFQKVKVVHRTLKKGSYRWKTWYVEGFDHLGRRIRIQRQSKTEAYAIASELDIKLLNSDMEVRPLATRLSKDQLKQAEYAFHRLNDRWTLDQVLDFFIKRHHEPTVIVTLANAREAFIEHKDRQGVKTRQLACVTRRMAKTIDPERPVHDVNQSDCEQFLAAVSSHPQTRNNYRSDLHNFFNFCLSRKWIAQNPITNITPMKVARRRPGILSTKSTEDLLRHLEGIKEGRMVRYYALTIFAGIRPGVDGEIYKLDQAIRSNGEARYIDDENSVIHMEPELTKTLHYRRITIRPNLAAWLQAYPSPIIPANLSNDVRPIRKQFKLTHDICRHTFISMHVAAFGSMGRAAIEAGNSESIVKKHYHEQVSEAEAKAFWDIRPSAVTTTAT